MVKQTIGSRNLAAAGGSRWKSSSTAATERRGNVTLEGVSQEMETRSSCTQSKQPFVLNDTLICNLETRKANLMVFRTFKFFCSQIRTTSDEPVTLPAIESAKCAERQSSSRCIELLSATAKNSRGKTIKSTCGHRPLPVSLHLSS
jgi:hypothetical protein